MDSFSIIIFTNQNDPTATMVENQLINTGADYLRLNTETFGGDFLLTADFTAQPYAIRLERKGNEFDLKNIRSIWYRRPLDPISLEAGSDKEMSKFIVEESRALLHGSFLSLDAFWVSHPQRIRLATHKLLQLKIADQIGFKVPVTLVSSNYAKVKDFYEQLKHEGKSMIAKLISKGPPQADTIDDQYVIFTEIIYPEDIRNVAAISCCPALYQEYIEKKYELRVTVVGNRAFACEIHSQNSEKTRIDWRNYDLPNTPHLEHLLHESLQQKCLDITKSFGLNFSAIDLVVTPDDEVYFLEINPNGQWGWIENLTGLPISRAIADLLISGKPL